MSRFIYEKSVSYKGHLILPYIFSTADRERIYSYTLLSQWASKGKFHKSENPCGIYSTSISGIINVAKEHLDENSEFDNTVDYFKCRYTYRNDIIIIYQVSGKYFYDHYKPESLNNVAAPKIFQSETDCINWLKQGLDRSQTGKEVEY